MNEQATLVPPAVADVAGAETGDQAGAEAGADMLVAGEELVEEVSIDGMCGVY